MLIIKKASKKFCKAFASILPANKLRVSMLKISGYQVGKHVYVGEGFLVIDKLQDKGNLVIGDRVSIAPRVTCITASDPNNSLISAHIRCKHGKIIIKDDAWIGTGSIILPDVTIGEGAVVGAGSVVTRSVEPYIVVAGVPARKIKTINMDCGRLVKTT